MLIKLWQNKSFISAFNSFRNHFRLSANTENKKGELQKMRNRDYDSERNQLIHQYNSQLKVQREQYAKLMLQVKRSEKKKKNTYKEQFGYQTHQQQFNFTVNSYTQKVNNLTRQFKEKLSRIDLEEKTNTVKLYLTDSIKEQQGTASKVKSNVNYQTGGFYIPNRFILKKMYLCGQKQYKESATGQQLLLAGVESDQEHCLFLNKLFQEFNIKNVVTMVPPDLPFFLKTQNSFAEQWKKFLQDSNYARKVKFYVNPKPKTLEQIALNAHYSPFVRSSLARSKSFLDTHYYLMQENQLTHRFEPMPLLTGICNQSVSKVYMADYPIFEQRKMLANNISLDKLRQLFHLHLKNVRENRLNFSAQWLFPKEVLKKKLSHLLGVAKAVTQKGEGRTILICPAEIAELVSIQWEIGNKQANLQFNYQDGKHYLNLGEVAEKQGEQTFVQFIEKLVILDVIMDQPVITNYFVKHKSFPFLCHHTIGGRENIGKIFIIWMHYYKTYYDILTEKRLTAGQQTVKRNEYFSKFQHPNDLQQ